MAADVHHWNVWIVDEKVMQSLIRYYWIFGTRLHVHLKKWTSKFKLLYLLNLMQYFKKITGYVAWVLLYKCCKFGRKICYSSRDIEFSLGDYYFWRTLYTADCAVEINWKVVSIQWNVLLCHPGKSVKRWLDKNRKWFVYQKVIYLFYAWMNFISGLSLSGILKEWEIIRNIDIDSFLYITGSIYLLQTIDMWPNEICSNLYMR